MGQGVHYGRGLDLVDADSPRAGELLRELHDEVLRPSFRPEEYVSPQTINPSGHLTIIACDDGGRVTGGALGEVYPASGAMLLGYLAVRPGLRGAGVGSALLSAVRERWLGQQSLAFLELDDPRHHAPDPARGDPEARLRFYSRFGIRLLVIPYFQPRLRGDLPRGYHMFLGVIPPKGVILPPVMPAQRVTAFLREYFEACEGAGSHADPEIQWLLDAAGGPEITLIHPEKFSRAPETTPPRDAREGRE